MVGTDSIHILEDFIFDIMHTIWCLIFNNSSTGIPDDMHNKVIDRRIFINSATLVNRTFLDSDSTEHERCFDIVERYKSFN